LALDRELPPESPPQFGLHPNAEIGYLTNSSQALFNTILSISGSADSGGGGGKLTAQLCADGDDCQSLSEFFDANFSQVVVPGVMWSSRP